MSANRSTKECVLTDDYREQLATLHATFPKKARPDDTLCGLAASYICHRDQAMINPDHLQHLLEQIGDIIKARRASKVYTPRLSTLIPGASTSC